MMWRPRQRGTALTSEGPLQVLPAHNVQLAKELMCLMLLELGLDLGGRSLLGLSSASVCACA